MVDKVDIVLPPELQKDIGRWSVHNVETTFTVSMDASSEDGWRTRVLLTHFGIGVHTYIDLLRAKLEDLQLAWSCHPNEG